MQNDFLECDKCCTKIFDYDAFGESKYEIINNEIIRLNSKKVFKNPIVTEIQKFNVFYLAEDYHQDFEKKNPNHPYIRAISKPRVSKFINSYSKIIKLKK